MGNDMHPQFEEEILEILNNKCLDLENKDETNCSICNEVDARSGKRFKHTTTGPIFEDCCFYCNRIADKYGVTCKPLLYKYLIKEEEQRLERAIENKYWRMDWAEDVYEKINKFEMRMEDV